MESPTSNFAGAGSPGANEAKRGGCSRILLFLILCALMLLPVLTYFTDTGEKVKRGVIEIIDAYKDQPEPVVKIVTEKEIVEVEVEKIVEVPAPLEPLPSDYVTGRTIDVAQLYNGFQLKSILDIQQGESASLERENPEGYEIQFQVRVKVPKASQTIDELSRLNQDLPALLPGLEAMLPTSRVSGFFHKLYELKGQRVQTYVTRLDKVPSRHNYYDCETILELTHPETEKRVLLIQGEMDVVSDGTDGDRMSKIDEYVADSDFFQPFTNYGWAKRSKTPNPLLARWEGRLRKYEEEFKIKGLPAERNSFLRASIDQLKREITDMKGRSFLIGQKDPFIVIPLSMLGYTKINSHAPAIGDYGVVIHGKRAFPAIVGDAGPSYKIGEASLFLAKAINEKATPYNRPESDLEVTYLVFPGSADEKREPPALDLWHERCLQLLDGIGGLGEGFTLHRWEDPFKPKPPPEPQPQPQPEPEPAAAGVPSDPAGAPKPEEKPQPPKPETSTDGSKPGNAGQAGERSDPAE